MPSLSPVPAAVVVEQSTTPKRCECDRPIVLVDDPDTCQKCGKTAGDQGC